MIRPREHQDLFLLLVVIIFHEHRTASRQGMTNWTTPRTPPSTSSSAPAVVKVTAPTNKAATYPGGFPLRPTVSLEARPIVVPILSCVFGFPVLALAIICALRYRAKRARKRSQMKRLKAASDRWRQQEEQLRGSFSVGDLPRDISFAVRYDESLEAEPASDACPPSRGLLGEDLRTQSRPKHSNGKLRVAIAKRPPDVDIFSEHSDVDFEYTEVDVI